MNCREKKQTDGNVITYRQILPACTPVRCIALPQAEIGPTNCKSGFCVQDVVQGSLNDCYLMAGLASTAFAADTTLATRYATMANSLPNRNIPVDGSNNPCYARIGPRNVIWPLIYERAYARQRGCDPCANPNSPVRPSCIEGGVGLQGLVDITGWRSQVIPIGTFDPTQIPNNNGNASVPAVAWTAAGDPGNNIFASHTYSYLGHTTDGFVILKNPTSAANYPTTNRKTTGTWTPNCCLTVNFNTPAYGIFGLQLAYFRSRFAGIGYVRQ